MSVSLEAALAVHRFGLGARPGELAAANGAPHDWLLAQLEQPADQPAAIDGAPWKTGGALVGELFAYRAQLQQEKQLNQPAQAAAAHTAKNQAESREYQREMEGRFALGFTTAKPFLERLVWFWSNHFTVSAQKFATRPFVSAFEREAIRPHVTGKFSDMLLAVTRHPAMLIYLDNAESIGPNSPAGLRTHKGLNENLGRELMELHTLGVDGGYTQADVIALANILTGWSLDRDGGASGFAFYPLRHEPGSFVLRGKTYSGGEDAGIAALDDLARDPATARHVARQFATHFVADEPPTESVTKLSKVFLDTNGDLKALAAAVVHDPHAWNRANSKMRSPVEYVTASLRLVGWPRGGNLDQQARGAMGATRTMGEFPLAAPSPKGWPDTSVAWSGPDALLNRIAWAKALGNRMPASLDALALAEGALGPLVNHETRAAMRACGTSGDSLALLVASPEFQRR